MDLSNIGVFDILWILFILLFLIPLIRKKFTDAARFALIRSIERARKSRVITMIHRQEGLSFLGVSLSYINIEDSERILRAIRLTPDDVPIDLILHTPGGIVLAATQIALALKKHPAEVRVIVPHYAMSGGTLIALAADRIIMDENAVLGPVDPQLMVFMKSYPAASLLTVSQLKEPKDMDDETLIYIDVARKALSQTKKLVCSLLSSRLEANEVEFICEKLTEGVWTHDHPLTVEDLRGMNLPVETKVPVEVYYLMSHYPQPTRLTPSVEYIPAPYKKEPKVK
ncbi:MAG: ATP-dependent Clp protease proteolytic subunit [Candidatus Altiarchaeota archaeon]|nr:ATP-dependent Clp protease proteolytic subunit [Candidatus Altiarchaeota archaeon]